MEIVRYIYNISLRLIVTCMIHKMLNTLRPRQNGCHFADDIFKRIFLNENILIPMKISLKFLPRDSINNIPALVQKMAWCLPGDKPLSEPMMVRLPTHICITRPQWVNSKKNIFAPYKQVYPSKMTFWNYFFVGKRFNFALNTFESCYQDINVCFRCVWPIFPVGISLTKIVIIAWLN